MDGSVLCTGQTQGQTDPSNVHSTTCGSGFLSTWATYWLNLGWVLMSWVSHRLRDQDNCCIHLSWSSCNEADGWQLQLLEGHGRTTSSLCHAAHSLFHSHSHAQSQAKPFRRRECWKKRPCTRLTRDFDSRVDGQPSSSLTVFNSRDCNCQPQSLISTFRPLIAVDSRLTGEYYAWVPTSRIIVVLSWHGNPSSC